MQNLSYNVALLNLAASDVRFILNKESNRLIFLVQVGLGSTAVSNFYSVPIKVEIN